MVKMVKDFQATIIPPIDESNFWEVLIPEHRSDLNSKPSFEDTSNFIRSSLCMGKNGTAPEVTKTDNGDISIKFEGGSHNFGLLEHVIGWFRNPKPHAY